MACLFPLKAFDIGLVNPSGKPKLKVLPRGSTAAKHLNGKLVEGVNVPCGKCINCRLDYSRQWAIRSYFECKEWKENYFLTLTYSNDYLPHGVGWSIDTGEIQESNTLDPKDLKKFIKDLRRYYEYHYGHIGIRFIASGEYGDSTHRPHYHLIMYNLPIKDLRLHKKTKTGDLFISDIISSIWGKGHVVIANVTWETSAYVARYVMKKQVGKHSALHYGQLGQVPEFIRHSRMPGIGRDYFEKNYLDIYSVDALYVNRGGQVITCKPVAYYDRLLAEKPQLGFWLDHIKSKRVEAAELHSDLVLSETDLNEFEYAELQYDQKIKQVEKLHKFKV